MAEPNDALLQELSRTEVVILTTVEGTLYGLSFALYISCCRLLLLELSKDKQMRRRNMFALSYMSLIMICGLLGLAVDARDVQVSWVDHPTAAPGGSYLYEVFVFARTAPATCGYAVGVMLDLLTFGAQIWRLSVMWRGTRYRFFVTIVPSLSLLGSIVIQIVSISDEVGHKIFTTSQGVVFGVVLRSLTLLTGLIVTSLIGAKIALVRRKHIQIMGNSDISNQYLSIIYMLVESFALEFIWSTISIATSFSDGGAPKSVKLVFGELVPSIQVIAYLLVVYRVSSGRAWKPDTERKLTSLRFDREEQQTTQLTTTQASIISGDTPNAQV